MRKALCFLICLLLAAAPYTVRGSEDPGVDIPRREAQAKYIELSKQADALLKEPLTSAEPPSAPISCADKDKTKAEGKNLADFLEAFNRPERPLCDQMLSLHKQLELTGARPDYAKEAALTGRLGLKALSLVEDYGQDIEKVPVIAAAALQTIKSIQLLGQDGAGQSSALMEAVSAMYAKAVGKLFDLLVEEHDYAAVQPILDAARASMLLSGNSGINTDDILERLQKALRFELEIVYRIDLPYDHWEEKSTLQVRPVSIDDLSRLEGNGTGSMISYTNDDVPEAYFTAPDFPVQAVLWEFLPCQGTVLLGLSPFYPPAATAHLPDDEEPMTWDWPIMKQGWDLAQANRLQDGLYIFPLTLKNLNAVPVKDTIETNPAPTLKTMFEVTLTHKPAN